MGEAFLQPSCLSLDAIVGVSVGTPPGMPGSQTPLQHGPSNPESSGLSQAMVSLAQYTPTRAGHRPVSSPARDGLHGVVRCARCGVRRLGHVGGVGGGRREGREV